MAKRITFVRWEAVGLPNGLTINENTGVISGKVDDEPGIYTATITVTTNYGSDTKTITIVIAIPDSWKPVIAPNQSIETVANEEMTPYQVIATNATKTEA